MRRHHTDLAGRIALHPHVRRHIGRNLDSQMPVLVLPLPSSAEHAVHGVKVRLCPPQSFVRHGLDSHPCEARPRRIGHNTTDYLVEKRADRAHRVMIQRVHVAALKAVGIGIAVPPLPDRRSAVVDHVAPGWHGTIQKQRVRQHPVTPTRQLQHQPARGLDAGRQDVAVALDA